MMNTISIRRIYFLFLIILLTGCDKEWLNERPNKNLAIPTTYKDLQALLDNNTKMNTSQPALGEVGSDGYYCRPDFVQYFTGPELNAYTWTHELPNENVSDWANLNNTGSYIRVHYCNIVLDGLGNLNPDGANEQITWNNVKGQALFQRARTFFELAQVFAPVYNSKTALTDLGIPLRLNSDVNIPTTRSTVKETYDQIVEDMKLALELLPEKAIYVTRASKWAVHGMLARIYLAMEDYANAKKHADQALKIDNYLLDFNDLTLSRSFPILRLNKEVIFQSNLANYTPIGDGLLVDNELFVLYSSNDLRQSAFFRLNTNGTISFKGSYYSSALLFGGLAVDELYLTRAECYARAGETTLASRDFNDLLRTRWKKVNNVSTYTDRSFNNADEALIEILRERRKELLFRGVRWSDLRRLNRDSRFAVTLTRTINGQSYSLEPNSFRYTFPIPDDIIQWTGIQQTPGW